MDNRRQQLKGRHTPFTATDILNQATGDAPVDKPQIIERVIEVTDPNAIVPVASGGYLFKRFAMTPVGMQLPPDVTADELLEAGRVLRNFETSIQWLVGDWLNAVQRVWGESYQDVAAELGYSLKTVYEYAYIARAVDFSIRMENLTFGHHQLVAKMQPADQRAWLEWAAQHNVSISQMRQEIAKQAATPTLPRPALADKKNRAVFSRIWRDLERGRGVSRDDIQHLRRWLDEIERLQP